MGTLEILFLSPGSLKRKAQTVKERRRLIIPILDAEKMSPRIMTITPNPRRVVFPSREESRFAPPAESHPPCSFPRKHEPRAERNDHEEVARKGVAADERSCNRRIKQFDIQSLIMSAENFEHPIEGFKDADQEDDEDEMFQPPILFSRKVPNLKKEEEADQGEPLDEMDLSGKGNHGERKT